MEKHVGRSELDSVIDSLPDGRNARPLLLAAVNRFGVEILDPFRNLRPQRLTTATSANKVSPTLTMTQSHSDDDREVCQPMLSGCFVPAPLGGRWGAPEDVPAEFAAASQKFAHQFRAQRTLLRRYSSWKKILGLCLRANVCPLPMSVGTAIGVVAHVANSGVSFGEVRAVRDAIAFVHAFKEYPDPTRDPSFGRVWSGIGRVLGTGNPYRKIALTRDELGQMIAIARKRGRPDHAVALAVCFEGALRVSELRALRVDDVHVEGNRVQLFIPHSKTDQGQQGEWVTLELRRNAPFDASAMLIAWMARLGRSEGYLFSQYRGGRIGTEPLNERTFTRIVKTYAAYLASPTEVGSHSLRAGWITEEITLGRPASEIAAHVRHSSQDMMLRYYRPRGRRRNLVRFASAGGQA
jgi:integrase